MSQNAGVEMEPSLAMWDRLSMPKPAGSAYSDSRESGVEENRDVLDSSSIHDRSCKKREQLTIRKEREMKRQGRV